MKLKRTQWFWDMQYQFGEDGPFIAAVIIIFVVSVIAGMAS